VAARFPTTHWSRVTAAADRVDPAARAALEDLCRDYWFPLYAFVRGRGHEAHDAEDIVQGFLADLLERDSLAELDRSKGSFRSFLRAACEHFLANQHDHNRAAKRGGGRKIISIDRLDAECRYGREPSHELTPERLFERQWAILLLERVLDRLEAESNRAGKTELFVALRPTLQGDSLAPPSSAIAAEIGMREGAVRVAAHRLRARYRELLREEVARTTGDLDEIDQEIADLLAALAGN
jgi:DNA-directed RNA polymerase specialized sigma24 family protein